MEIKYYLVEDSALPDVLKKVLDVKKILETDLRMSIDSACIKADLSRSTYYKYKDRIFEFYENRKGHIVTFSLNLMNEPGILSRMLESIAGSKANILTINQNIPMNGIAIVVISIETFQMELSLEDLINKLRDMKGVQKVDILSRS